MLLSTIRFRVALRSPTAGGRTRSRFFFGLFIRADFDIRYFGPSSMLLDFFFIGFAYLAAEV